MSIHIRPSMLDPELVDVELEAAGHGTQGLPGLPVPEAIGLHLLAVPFTLAALRSVLDRDLARGIARELNVPYEGLSGPSD